MDESRKLQPAQMINDLFTNVPTKDVIHVLVQLPDEGRHRKRARKDAEVKTLDFKADENFVDESAPDEGFFMVHGLDIAGLCNQDTSTKMIYRREDTMKLMGALDSMENGIRIFGPPGIGKSITTWLWACNQVKKGKSVLWIHVSCDTRHHIIRPSPRGSFSLVPYDSLQFIGFAEDDIVVIDGVSNAVDHIALKKEVFSFDVNPNRQAICVASLTFSKTSPEDLERLKISSFEAVAWSLEEYYEATENEEFFQRVQPYLCDGDDKKEQIDKKYYFAGCSARWMFGKDVSAVVDNIEKAFKRCGNVVDLLKGVVGHENPVVVNHLSCDQGSYGRRFFTSQYVARLAVERGGNEVIRLRYGVANGLENGSFAGWIVELDFIQQIKDAKGSDLEVFRQDNSIQNIEVSSYKVCDMKTLDIIQTAQIQDLTIKILNNVWLLISSVSSGLTAALRRPELMWFCDAYKSLQQIVMD
ncbi:unnamed protein product [Aphanomyces euteiches]